MRRADRGRRPALRARRGVALLEALVALVILTTAGAAVIALGAESARAVERARSADGDMRRASAFMEAVALWPREDLDRRLGDHAQGPWRLRVDRPLATLYLVTLTDSTGARTLLTTALFRPEPAHAQP